MPEYEASRNIPADPEGVFQYVSDVNNLPQYLPTTHSAQPQGQGRVQVRGETQGHEYSADGFFHRDGGQNRMSWGSDGEMRYRGWMRVEPDGDSGSRVTVHLSFDPPENMKQQMQDPGAKIQEGLEKALESIANLVEGKGAKVEPQSAQPTDSRNL